MTALELRLSPHGVVTPEPYVSDERWAAAIVSRFAECEAAGLITLAAAPVPHEAQASVTFWRDVAAGFVRALCHVPESTALDPASFETPTTATLTQWTMNAPPMPGAEYLNPAVLGAVWRRLLQWTAAQVEACGGLGAFLQTYASQWSRVGRVTLHLAENKDDAEYPFAFMATYATGLSRAGRISRLPLGRALQEYADARKKPELLKLLSPLHAAARRSALVADLVDTGDVFHPLVWSPAEAYAFLQEIPLYEECGLLSQLPDWWHKRPRPRVSVTLDSGHKQSTLGQDALLDFHVEVALEDQLLSAEEVSALLQADQGLMLLKGRWVEVNGEKLRAALQHWKQVERSAGTDGLSFIEGMRLLAGASADLKDADTVARHVEWSEVQTGGRLRALLAGLRSPAELDGMPPRELQGALRHYQLDGLNWLWLCSQLGLGCCLADDMGLGKTIQMLAALLRHKQRADKEPPSTPSLLVVPASLIGNWMAEADRFAPALKVLVAHPSDAAYALLGEQAKAPARLLRDVDLVITTYGMVARLEWLKQRPWQWVILDEAQAIKNPSARQTRAVKQLRGLARVALTGTPVENRLGDLWSIFDFLNPGLLGSATRFKAFAKSLESREQARYAPLRKLVAPYILRRMKTDPTIAPELPDKTEIRVFCGLSKTQAALYQHHVTALARALQETGGDGMRRRGLVLSYLLRFKQICNHPSQLTGDALYPPEASAKFQRLGEICAEIASRGEKALVFTQFRELTDPLADFLADVFGRGGLVLHGGTAVKQRKGLVERFQREDGPPFFVLSIKAGGTGLNLTAAAHVIHLDRWWNPAVENQATDRAFRIGQQRNVLVHKFVTRGTVEEKIDALLQQKQAMADALLADDAEKALTEMSNEEIIALVSLDIERARE